MHTDDDTVIETVSSIRSRLVRDVLPRKYQTHKVFRRFFSSELSLRFFCTFILYFCSVLRLSVKRHAYTLADTPRHGVSFAQAHHRVQSIFIELTWLYYEILTHYSTFATVRHRAAFTFQRDEVVFYEFFYWMNSTIAQNVVMKASGGGGSVTFEELCIVECLDEQLHQMFRTRSFDFSFLRNERKQAEITRTFMVNSMIRDHILGANETERSTLRETRVERSEIRDKGLDAKEESAKPEPSSQVEEDLMKKMISSRESSSGHSTKKMHKICRRANFSRSIEDSVYVPPPPTKNDRLTALLSGSLPRLKLHQAMQQSSVLIANHFQCSHTFESIVPDSNQKTCFQNASRSKSPNKGNSRTRSRYGIKFMAEHVSSVKPKTVPKSDEDQSITKKSGAEQIAYSIPTRTTHFPPRHRAWSILVEIQNKPSSAAPVHQHTRSSASRELSCHQGKYRLQKPIIREEDLETFTGFEEVRSVLHMLKTEARSILHSTQMNQSLNPQHIRDKIRQMLSVPTDTLLSYTKDGCLISNRADLSR